MFTQLLTAPQIHHHLLYRKLLFILSGFLPVVRNLSNDDIIKYAAAFAHLELQYMGSSFPEAQSVLPVTSQTTAR